MDAIILAAGKGSRTELEYPKQFMSLGGKPLFIHSVEMLYGIEGINKIIIAVIPCMREIFQNILKQYNFENIICVDGGETRQQSVYNALKYCMEERVIIQAAARPFVTKEYLQELISMEGDAIVPYSEQIYSVIHKDGYYLNRNDLVSIHLPQIFNTTVLKKAHELAVGKNYIEDSELVFNELGIFPKLVKSIEGNFKITNPLDIKMAELIYENM
ncbi:IspD/TarI family cytidylyltransferase [Anaerovorax odorimutans]|uniref:IspD/TarI family cytidylyltransferase n=1 Tax=Anaerovorax odorimutans TaxID=109327 RepID=UPI000419E50D|nr:IspD/TarI family cytidylyltransferase [Anaerovorax odorimutans]